MPVKDDEKNKKPRRAEDVLWFYDMLAKPWKVLWFNFSMGIFRGLGFALGLTVVAGIVLTLLYKIASHAMDLPLIGDFIGEIINIIKENIDTIQNTRKP